MKELLKERFETTYPSYRLLAIQLNGFSHKIFCDEGSRESSVKILEYSSYTDGKGSDLWMMFFGIPHSSYQNNAIEYVYVMPSER